MPDSNEATVNIGEKRGETTQLPTGGESKKKFSIEVYQKALDDLYNMNSLFTVAVFIGLSFSASSKASLDDRRECDASTTMLRLLVIFEMLSFSMFLSSNLATKTLKLELYFRPGHVLQEFPEGQGYLLPAGQVMFLGAVFGSFMACLSLVVSMLFVIQIKLGKATCLNSYTMLGIVYMCSVFAPAILVYIRYVMVAINSIYGNRP